MCSLPGFWHTMTPCSISTPAHYTGTLLCVSPWLSRTMRQHECCWIVMIATQTCKPTVASHLCIFVRRNDSMIKWSGCYSGMLHRVSPRMVHDELWLLMLRLSNGSSTSCRLPKRLLQHWASSPASMARSRLTDSTRPRVVRIDQGLGSKLMIVMTLSYETDNRSSWAFCTRTPQRWRSYSSTRRHRTCRILRKHVHPQAYRLWVWRVCLRGGPWYLS